MFAAGADALRARIDGLNRRIVPPLIRALIGRLMMFDGERPSTHGGTVLFCSLEKEA
jgi:hypothetical protein